MMQIYMCVYFLFYKNTSLVSRGR